MKKKYESPMLEDIMILSSDIICASGEAENDNEFNIDDLINGIE